MAKILTQAAVEKLKPIPGKRRFVRDAGSRSLFLVIQPTGFKSWVMRFRRSGGAAAKLVLGPLDLSRRAPPSREPEIGQPLTLVAARQLAAKINAERASGRDVIADHKARKHRQRVKIAEAAANSFAAAARSFVEQHAKAKTRGWKETARNLGLEPDDLEPRKNGLAERWADRDAREIDAHDLYAVVEEARRFGTPGIPVRGDKISEARARHLHDALSGMFGWLVRHRRIAANPMASVHKPDKAKARDRVLTDAEIAKFWAAAVAVTEPFGAVIKLLLITGSRLNEIARLQWSEVSDDGSTLTIPGNRTKNKLPFSIFLPPVARDIISAVHRFDGCDYVFSTNGATAISGWSKIKQRLDAAISIPPWRIHDLRRTAATGMSEVGIAPHIVEACLNHISGAKASVAGIYNRAQYGPEKKAALERWSDHLASVVSGKPAKVVPIRGSRP
jgi:integrase